nr:hypothetical protein [Mucilaginibacter sp. FT3.2]
MSQLNFFITRDETISILNALIDTNEVEVFIGCSFEMKAQNLLHKLTPQLNPTILHFG